MSTINDWHDWPDEKPETERVWIEVETKFGLTATVRYRPSSPLMLMVCRWKYAENQ
jgi:hypothetical protein